jgi:catalase (peroxidase I)
LTAAISGAHAVGKASLNNSGYEGYWGSKYESGKFNNHYYKAILNGGWGPLREVAGNKDKNMWIRTDGHAVKNATNVFDYE